MVTSGEGRTPYLRLWYEVGIDGPGLRLRRVQLRAFTESDGRALRDEFGASGSLSGAVRGLSAAAGDARGGLGACAAGGGGPG